MASGAEETSNGQDNDLDELLDSALEDFDKTTAPPAPEPVATAAASSTKPPLLEDCKLFETLFEGDMANQAKQEMEKAMKELAQEEPELLKNFQKLSEAAGKVGTDSASQKEFTSCLQDTLHGMAKNADNLESTGLAGEELIKTLEGMALGGNAGIDEGKIMPIMQSIMQNLLSKEVLYPSLKEITTRYPEWLEENKASLSTENYQRYGNQARVMAQVCSHFEKEEEGAADKEASFERIMDLMQKLQELGEPPKDLAGESPTLLNMDSPAFLGEAGSAEQCSVM